MQHRRKPPVLWVPHIDGVSFRALGNTLGLSAAAVYLKVVKEMNKLPDNTWLSQKYCNRYCGILVVDCKYVKVKGYKAKIPFIYGIDYLTHDIPVGILAPSENEEAFLKFFRLLKACHYPLRVVICDDRSTVATALKYYYPKAKLRMCQNHYVENIRQALHTRIDTKHQQFFNYIYTYIFSRRQTTHELFKSLHYALASYAQTDTDRQTILFDIHRRRRELFQYPHIDNCPKDTNLIELYNSHLQSRLKSIKGFKSFRAAECWLNAYLIRRRLKPLTDCDYKFRHLNGQCSLKRTLKRGLELPQILGIKIEE